MTVTYTAPCPCHGTPTLWAATSTGNGITYRIDCEEDA